MSLRGNHALLEFGERLDEAIALLKQPLPERTEALASELRDAIESIQLASDALGRLVGEVTREAYRNRPREG